LQLVVTPARGAELAPREPGLGAASHLLFTDERVEHTELVRAAGEAPLLELARHREEPFADGCEILACGGSAPGVRARSPVREDAPREHEPLLALGAELRKRRQIVVVEQRGRDVELCLDVGLVAVGPDVARVALRPKQQADRLREDRLARAGLARDRVQAGREGELRLMDEDEILDAEPAQHLPPRMVSRAAASHHRQKRAPT
jgi:hypothetical protein